MSDKTTGQTADVEMLAQWEGPAEHAPGVLFEESGQDGMLSGEVGLLDLAGWVAVTALSGVVGNTAYAAVKDKVLGVLTAWRRQKGQAKLDALRHQVFEEMRKHAPNGKLTEEELKARIDAFFEEIRG